MAELGDVANDFLREEIEEFVERPEERTRLIEQYARTPDDLLLIAAALVDGDDDTVDELTRQALDEGRTALEVMDDGLIAGMALVGIKFRENFIFVPEVLACARAMKAGFFAVVVFITAHRNFLENAFLRFSLIICINNRVGIRFALPAR